ncbi:MAG: RIP metalloprotease RseP [Pseudomonadota bacterium]
MGLIEGIGDYLIPFLVVLTILVFVHEWGHFWVARRCGVRVQVFSVGFGPELFGRTDRHGTRWKFSLIPLGGYVKMFGDANAASMPDGSVQQMTDDERAVSFFHKPLWKRAAIVAAGPMANFLFAAIALAILFAIYQHPFPPSTVGTVQEGSPAELAGIEPGDRIVAVDGRSVGRFSDLVVAVQSFDGEPLAIDLRRDGNPIELSITPALVEVDRGQGVIEVPRIGVSPDAGPYDVPRAIGMGVVETFALIGLTIDAIGEIIVGDRSTEELGGPIRIAQMSGDVAQFGILALVWFTALLSINLGLINLLPVPVLDGGHLLFYAIEAVRGRPLGEKAQEVGFRLGVAFVLGLMIFATWNDLVQLDVVAWFQNLIS